MRIQKLITRRGFWGTLKIGTGFIITNLLTIWPYSSLSEKLKRQIRVFLTVGYWPDVNQPKTFNEHLSNEFLYGNKNEVLKVHDKYIVRKYVSDLDLGRYLSKLYTTFKQESDIDLYNLPNEFVLKSNYGGSSKHVIVVKDFHSYSSQQVKFLKDSCKKWLSKEEIKSQMSDNFFISGIEPVILVEELLAEKEISIPLDYKYYILNKKIAFIEVVQGRFDTGPYVTIYNEQWDELPFKHGNPKGKSMLKPHNLDEMNEVAKKLSTDFKFVRIDLYNLNNTKIVFGEITPLPGTLPFKPSKYDLLFGEWTENEHI